MVLPALLMVTVILVILASTLVRSGTSSLRLATHEQHSDQALYAAEAGLAAAVEEYDRTSELDGERKGKLEENGSTYRVLVLENEDIAARAVHHELLPPEGVILPAGTMYLLSIGTSENGTSRRAGALFRTGLEAIEVGVLSDRLAASNSAFKAYDSSVNVDPGGAGKADSGLLASRRVDPMDTSAEFDLANSAVEGGVYVAPHSTTDQGIVKTGSTTVAREGVLSDPIALEEIVVPDIAGNGSTSSSDPGGSGGGTKAQKPVDQLQPSHFIEGELKVRWTNTEVEFLKHENGQWLTMNKMTVNSLQSLIDKAYSEDSEIWLADDSDDETLYFSPDGKLYLREDDGEIEESAPFSGDLKEVLNFGSSKQDAENPDSLAGDKEYGTVKISDSTPTRLENGVMVIENLEITSGGKLELPADGKATIYVTGKLTVEGENALLNSSKLPPNLKIYYTGTDPVQLSGGSAAYFTLIAPDSDVLLKGEGAARTHFFGALVGKSVQVENADFFFDVATKGIGTGAQGFSLRLLNRHRL